MAETLFRKLEFSYGACETVAPGVRRVIAENPSPFTFHGTVRTSLARVTLLQTQGRPIPSIAALLKAVEGETISHVL